eukprot:TRINITY_DN32700_c0_g1_i4.p1 TRINITY_DN32700_c0_g1~~TRINITY_DN32700_c0_g1_i4.p1  ORF type:complete len:354 (-),score=16.08 TRINITY_DN32700_c0_g1_i4:200-1261(-)
MSGRSCSAKNFAVIAAIALPLFVPTGAINLALSETATVLSSANFPIWTQFDSAVYTDLFNQVNTSDGLVGHRIKSCVSKLPWFNNPTERYPKVGWVTSYFSPEENEAYGVYEDRVRESGTEIPYLMRSSIQQLVTTDMLLSSGDYVLKPDSIKTVLSALYAPVELEGGSDSDMEHSKNMLSLCWSFATPFHFSLIVEDNMRVRYTKVVRQTTILPYMFGTYKKPMTKATTFLNSITDVKCRTFVEEQFQGLVAIMNNPRYPEKLLQEGGQRLEEAIGIFLHWLIYFAKIHPYFLGRDDNLFFRPFFEATLAAMNEELENATAPLEQKMDHLHVWEFVPLRKLNLQLYMATDMV